MADLKQFDVSKEAYREIVWVETGAVYRIERPISLFIRPGGSTHRVVDLNGIAHCYPAPEKTGLTVIRWKNIDTDHPVNF